MLFGSPLSNPPQSSSVSVKRPSGILEGEVEEMEEKGGNGCWDDWGEDPDKILVGWENWERQEGGEEQEKSEVSEDSGFEIDV